MKTIFVFVKTFKLPKINVKKITSWNWWCLASQPVYIEDFYKNFKLTIFCNLIDILYARNVTESGNW